MDRARDKVIDWKCTNSKLKCKVRIRTDDTESIVVYTKNDHCHAADKHKNEKQILCNSVKRKAISDLTQKPPKLIRIELVKMTSEASLLQTDLKNIHQTVNRSRKKCFLNCLRADMFMYWTANIR